MQAKKGESVSDIRAHEILDSLKNCNGFETKQILAKEFDISLKVQEIVRPQKDESVRVEITFTKEQFEELKKAKSLLSHIAHSGSLAEVISVMARKFNQSKLGKSKLEQKDFATDVRNLKSIKVTLPSPLLWRPYISV